ncbi:MAG: MarR family transcriptional regulator, partial [Halioglobus sp.]
LLRASDPSDGRAKLLVTTPRAKALIKQGANEALNLEACIAKSMGEADFSQLNLSLTKLCRKLDLLFPYEGDEALTLAATLPRMSDYITQRLQLLTMEKGHPHLKRSFGTVLTAIGPRGGRIQQMANSRDISKQAVSAIANELEALGYIRRMADPGDARQIVLQLSTAGKALITDSVESVNQLAAEFSAIIGEDELRHLKNTIARIYRYLHLEEEIFGDTSSNDIEEMARQINSQLGKQGALALGELLLAGSSGK